MAHQEEVVQTLQSALSSGNVGIGTQTPATALSVAGFVTSAGGGAYLDGYVDSSGFKVLLADTNGKIVKDNQVPAADKPFYVYRFHVNGDNPIIAIGLSTNTYTAMLVGTYAYAGGGTARSGGAMIFKNTSTNQWWVWADFAGPNENYWDFDIST